VPAVEGREVGWPAWTFAAFAAALPAAGLFVAAERRIAARGGSPLLELQLFDARGFRIGLPSAVVLYFVISFFFLLAIYLQDGLGLNALESGLAFTPIAVALGVAGIGTIFFGQLGSATGAAAYGDAFTISLAVQAAFALAAAALVSRARQTVRRPVLPASERA
jgi:hypothetical protein